MTELILSRDERLDLKARAHHLNVVVLLGAAGLSEAVVKEIDRALAAHELIKIRVPGDDRDAREAIFADLAGRLGAARVQRIGKLLVLYRPAPEAVAEEEVPKDRSRKRAPKSAKTIKPAKRPAPRPARKPAARKTSRRS